MCLKTSVHVFCFSSVAPGGWQCIWWHYLRSTEDKCWVEERIKRVGEGRACSYHPLWEREGTSVHLPNKKEDEKQGWNCTDGKQLGGGWKTKGESFQSENTGKQLKPCAHLDFFLILTHRVNSFSGVFLTLIHRPWGLKGARSYFSKCYKCCCMLWLKVLVKTWAGNWGDSCSGHLTSGTSSSAVEMFSKQSAVGFTYKYLSLQWSLKFRYWKNTFWTWWCGPVKASLLPIWKKMHLYEPEVFAAVLDTQSVFNIT